LVLCRAAAAEGCPEGDWRERMHLLPGKVPDIWQITFSSPHTRDIRSPPIKLFTLCRPERRWKLKSRWLKWEA